MSSTELPDEYSKPAHQNALIPLVVILGPTAVGKSEAALLLADRFHGEIVSADSRMFYRGMDIGTAKPSVEEQARVPHHLIDVAYPDEVWSLAIFQKEANKAILSIYQQKHLPFLVGGTGQFMRAIIEGWSVPPVVPNPRLREVLTQWANGLGAIEIHAKLARIDPQAANLIDPTNVRRTVRALEVILSTGKRFSDQKKRGQRVYNPILLGLSCPRPELYRRIDERITRMINSGFIQEVQSLLDQGYSPDLPTMSAIGYGEIVAYIQGKINLDDAIISMKRRTRVFVRRQANWFKRSDPQIHWFESGEAAIDEMSKLISKWLEVINWDEYLSKNLATG